MEFSIVIPTRDRPDTLRHSLATIIEQPGDDYEIVVADNSASPEAANIVERAHHINRRVKYTHSDEPLSMAENFERGLEQSSGRYVTFIGDDDGLVPSALELARKILAVSQCTVLSWDTHYYWWPDTIISSHANLLYADVGDATVGWRDSTDVSRDFFNSDDPENFVILPMIYRGFVRRDLIQEAKRRYGYYFRPAALSPDIWLTPDAASGVVNLRLADHFVHLRRPLTICGMSGHSTGLAFLERSRGERRRADFLKSQGKTLDQLCHPSLIASPNFHIIMASTKLWLKECYFSDRHDLRIDLGGVVRAMIRSLNADPHAYEANLADALTLARKVGVFVDPKDIPPKIISPIAAGGKRSPGPFVNERNRVCIAIDCDAARIYNVADAARFAEAVSPSCGDDRIAQLSSCVMPHQSSSPKHPTSRGKVSRNDPCPCGSGKKYKHCHGQLA
jgi:hypothetical protein